MAPSARLTPAPATVAELVRALDLEGKRIAVERNGEIVPKGRYGATARRVRATALEIVAASAAAESPRRA